MPARRPLETRIIPLGKIVVPAWHLTFRTRLAAVDNFIAKDLPLAGGYRP